MPPRFDYKKTFLAQHIAEELEHVPRPNPNYREEILAVLELRERYALRKGFDPRDPALARVLPVRNFFYGLPEHQLYRPIGIRQLVAKSLGGTPSTTSGRPWKELSHLLREPSSFDHGIVLLTRTGAGKTTAMRKAVYDCFEDSLVDDSDLRGYLPCYLRSLRTDEGTKPTVAYLLRRAAGLGHVDLKRFQTWIDHSPPLLVFIDLNAATEEDRRELVPELIRWQTAEDTRRRQHRLVVAYRANVRDEQLIKLLSDRDGAFLPYDLEPLTPKTALDYITNLTRYQAVLLGENLEKLDEKIEANLKPIEEFLREQVQSRDSMISIPIFMHFVSILGPEVWAEKKITTLADLYEAVATKLIERQYATTAIEPTVGFSHRETNPFATPAHRYLLDVALTRIALAALSNNSTRFTGASPDIDPNTTPELGLEFLMETPNKFGNMQPTDQAWRDTIYFKDNLIEKVGRGHDPVELRESIPRHPLLRQIEGEGIAFLHDSFLYFYAARHLRRPEHPQIIRLDSSWPARAADRLYREFFMTDAQNIALFLGGMLEKPQGADLASHLVTQAPKEEWPKVVRSFVRACQPHRDDTESNPKDVDPIRKEADRRLRGLADMFRRRAGAYEKYPGILFQDAYHYTRDVLDCPESDDWLQAMRTRYEATGQIWFRSVCGTKWLPPHFPHKDQVKAVALLRDGRSVSASDDGTVVIWDGETGASEVIKQVPDGAKVTCLAVAKEADIVLFGDSQGRVWRWMKETKCSVDEPFIVHGNTVNSVALSADGQVVVSGGWDNIVYRRTDGNDASATPWKRLEEEKQSPYIEHGGTVTSVALSADGQVVVSGGEDNIVYRRTDGNVASVLPWGDLEEQKQSPYIEHGGSVNSVALSADGQVVVSGGWDKIVYRRTDGNDASATPWKRLEEEKQSPYIKHGNTVNSVALSADGRVVVSGGSDDIVYRRTDGNVDEAKPWEGLEKEKKSPYIEHGNTVNSVALSADGQVVVSGGLDKIVYRRTDGNVASALPWGDLEGEKQSPYIEHGWTVNSVALSADGQVVVSGGTDKIVYRRTDGNDDEAKPWGDLEEEKKSPYIKHRYWVLSVALSADGQVVVSGGLDSIVYRRTDGNDASATPWKRLEGEQKSPYIEHGGTVTSVALSADGQVVVSGGWDNKVYRRTDGNDASALPWGNSEEEKQSPYIKHGNTVNSVALSADGQVVVSGGSDDIVYRRTDGNDPAAKPWNGLLQHEKYPYIVHADRVHSVACSSDGRVVVSGGRDNLLQLVSEATTGDPSARLSQVYLMMSSVTAVAIPKDFNHHPRVIVGCADGWVHLLDVEPWATQRRKERSTMESIAKANSCVQWIKRVVYRLLVSAASGLGLMNVSSRKSWW